MTAFTFRGARSTPTLVAISAVVVIETVAFHLLLRVRHPVAAWSASASSIALLAWLLVDSRRLGESALHVDAATLSLSVGLRFSVCIPRELIASVIAPTWRDLPSAGGEYLNATKPGSPNVLLTLREPVPIRLLGMVTRPVRQIGLCLDDPKGFLRELEETAERGRTITHASDQSLTTGTSGLPSRP